jgi:hypothetical protein
VKKISILRHETTVAGGTTTPRPATVILVTTLIVGVLAACIPIVKTTTGVITHGDIVSNADSIGWLLVCTPSHTLPDDPIKFPGHPGASHLHDFWRNASTTGSSTLATQEASSNDAVQNTYVGSNTAAGTSCDLSTYAGTADTASYWAPTVYANGVQIVPDDKAELYYRAKPVFNTNFVPFPQDARLVVGNHDATSVASNPALVSDALHFECDGDTAHHYTAPPTTCTTWLMIITFPSCYDGGPMDHTGPIGTDNERFTYASNANDGTCPSNFPISVPTLSERFEYTVPTTGMDIEFSADPTGPMAGMLMPTYTAHADFWNTWQPAALRYLVTHCINAQISCGTNPIVPVGP